MPRRRTEPRSLFRFAREERWVHRATAALMLTCLATAAVLYVGPLSVLVGRRALMVRIHVYAGLALPLPALLGWLSAAYRADLRELNRFHAVDGEWLRSSDRRSGRLAVGKFNAGQKLNAAFVAGAIVVQLASGVVMQYGRHSPLYLRSGATFVHDWLAAAVFVVLAGHLYFAYRDPDARRGMRTGWVPVAWARREHRSWAERELAAIKATRTSAQVGQGTTE
jgi:formate dehydrogenase subunit gamma